MEKEKKYNLRGLNLVFISLLLSIIPAIVMSIYTQFASANIGEGLATGNVFYLALLGFTFLMMILVIIGLSMVKKYSVRFKKARNIFIGNLILTIVAVGLIVGGVLFVFYSINSDGDAPEYSKTIMLICLALAAICYLATIIINLLFIKNLMGGCAEIANSCGDKGYGFKCSRTWIEYWILIILTVGSVVSAIIVSGNALIESLGENGGTVDTIFKMNGMASGTSKILIPVSLVLILLTGIVYLLMIFRVRGTYSRFNLYPILPTDEEIEKENSEKRKMEANSGINPIEPKVISPISKEPSPLDQMLDKADTDHVEDRGAEKAKENEEVEDKEISSDEEVLEEDKNIEKDEESQEESEGKEN